MRLEAHVQAGRLNDRQIRHSESRDAMGSFWRQKRRGWDSIAKKLPPVPQTDTGRQEENSKVRGKTLVKELGKIYP